MKRGTVCVGKSTTVCRGKMGIVSLASDVLSQVPSPIAAVHIRT
jgi:hypothetical protein